MQMKNDHRQRRHRKQPSRQRYIWTVVVAIFRLFALLMYWWK